MDLFYFIVRHTPFWAIPCIILGLEFTYRYWLKRKRLVYGSFGSIATLSLIALIYYFWAGGPEGSVLIFIDIFNN